MIDIQEQSLGDQLTLQSRNRASAAQPQRFSLSLTLGLSHPSDVPVLIIHLKPQSAMSDMLCCFSAKIYPLRLCPVGQDAARSEFLGGGVPSYRARTIKKRQVYTKVPYYCQAQFGKLEIRWTREARPVRSNQDLPYEVAVGTAVSMRWGRALQNSSLKSESSKEARTLPASRMFLLDDCRVQRETGRFAKSQIPGPVGTSQSQTLSGRPWKTACCQLAGEDHPHEVSTVR